MFYEYLLNNITGNYDYIQPFYNCSFLHGEMNPSGTFGMFAIRNLSFSDRFLNQSLVSTDLGLDFLVKFDRITANNQTELVSMGLLHSYIIIYNDIYQYDRVSFVNYHPGNEGQINPFLLRVGVKTKNNELAGNKKRVAVFFDSQTSFLDAQSP